MPELKKRNKDANTNDSGVDPKFGPFDAIYSGGDYLKAEQDKVAQEAYLETTRNRQSNVRLPDLHEPLGPGQKDALLKERLQKLEKK